LYSTNAGNLGLLLADVPKPPAEDDIESLIIR
jgi:hypothetical protein